MKNKKRKIRSEKGSITIFVIVTMLFIVIASLLLYSRVMNNKSTENRQVKQIESQYSVSNDQLAEAYNDVSSHVTVTFDANGGQVSTSPKRVKIGDSYGSLPTPTRDGYKFMGWNGKNLFDGLFKLGVISSGTNYTNVDFNDRSLTYSDLNSKFYTLGGYFKAGTYVFNINSDTHWYSLNRVAIAETNCIQNCIQVNSIRCPYTWTQSVDGYTYFSIERDTSSDNLTDIEFDQYDFNLQIEEGSEATEYEPFFVTSSTKVTQTKDHTLTAIWEEE